MRILFVGSARGTNYWAALLDRFTYALRSLGHKVSARAYHEIDAVPQTKYDLLILQDTHLDAGTALQLKSICKHYALITHSESIQGQRDLMYIRITRPDAIFTDQPIGVDLFKPECSKVVWMGVGADPRCKPAPRRKIDVLWVGNKYPERDRWVQEQVMNIERRIPHIVLKMYGAGYRDGPLPLYRVRQEMGKARIVVHIGHPVTDKDGYGGMRIADALASGAYVVSTKYYKCRDMFNCHGVTFVERDGILNAVESIVTSTQVEENAMAGREYVLQNLTAVHNMKLLLKTVWSS